MIRNQKYYKQLTIFSNDKYKVKQFLRKNIGNNNYYKKFWGFVCVEEGPAAEFFIT